MPFTRLSRAGAVLVEPSDVVLRNAGDMAMLEVAATRLADRFPGAPILVLSDTPDRLPRYRPGVRPLATTGRRAWRAGERSPAARGFVDAVAGARLVVVAGMGGITDAFADYARDVLDTVDLAIRHGVPTVMMGQGIGPLVETELRALAARILPQVDRIALREARAGGPLLHELGVSAERVLVTGDDAIELALPAGAPAEPALGPGLGVNLRVADYAAVSDAMIAAVRLGVQRAAGRLPRAPLVPLPISRVPGEEDAATIRRLTEGYDVVDAEGPALDGPRDVVARTRRCRVVVAGSYHAGVFALASGIPVVGLAGSDYYRDKLLGLADQFGCGCEVISLQEPHLAPRIETAVSSLWARAEELRPRLIAAAERQRAASRAAYDGLPALARRRRRGRAAYRQLRAVAARWLR